MTKHKLKDLGKGILMLIGLLAFVILYVLFIVETETRPSKVPSGVIHEPILKVEAVVEPEPIPEPPKTVEEIIEEEGRKEGLETVEVERMKEIAWCESRYNPQAVSQTGDYGLLQIHTPLWSNYYGLEPEELFDPLVNVQTAIKIYKRSNSFKAWACDKLV